MMTRFWPGIYIDMFCMLTIGYYSFFGEREGGKEFLWFLSFVSIVEFRFFLNPKGKTRIIRNMKTQRLYVQKADETTSKV